MAKPKLRAKIQIAVHIKNLLCGCDNDLREHALRCICNDDFHYLDNYDDESVIENMLIEHHTLKELQMDLQIATAIYEMTPHV